MSRGSRCRADNATKWTCRPTLRPPGYLPLFDLNQHFLPTAGALLPYGRRRFHTKNENLPLLQNQYASEQIASIPPGRRHVEMPAMRFHNYRATFRAARPKTRAIGLLNHLWDQLDVIPSKK
jgi:hypothetical protein